MMPSACASAMASRSNGSTSRPFWQLLRISTGPPFSVATTGNPLAAAIGLAALQILEDEGLIENSAKLGEWFLERLRELDHASIQEVRGRGLWIGLQLRPEVGGARRYCEALMAEGLLCKETHENVIRFAPPLVITKKELNMALRRVKKVFKKLDG